MVFFRLQLSPSLGFYPCQYSCCSFDRSQSESGLRVVLTFSTRFLRMRSFILTSPLDKERFPMSLFKRVTLQTGIFLLNQRKAILGTFNLATKPARSHHVLTAFFDAGLERQLSINISRALLFDFVFFFVNCFLGLSVKYITILLFRISI